VTQDVFRITHSVVQSTQDAVRFFIAHRAVRFFTTHHAFRQFSTHHALAAAAIAILCAFPQPLTAQPAAPRSDTVVRLATTARHPGGGTLVADLSIGSETAGPDYQFTQITSVLAAKDGSVWVLEDDLEHRVIQLRRYSATGAYLGTVGRRGEGPGEFITPTGIAQLPDGRVLVRDITGNKIDVYTAAGAPAATWTFGSTRLNWTVNGRDAIVADTAGIIYLPILIAPDWANAPPVPGRSMGPADRGERQALVRLRSDGTIIDTIPRPALPDVSLSGVVAVVPSAGGTRGGGAPPGVAAGAGGRRQGAANAVTISRGVPYSPRSDWYWSPLGYVVTVVTSRYAIDLLMPNAGRADAPGAGRSSVPPRWREGDPVVSIRRDIPPVPVTEAERADQRRMLDDYVATLRGRGGTLTDAAAEIPRVKPAMQGVAFGRDGRLWVAVRGPSERLAPNATPAGRGAARGAGWTEPAAVDVFEPNGTFVGRVTVPDGVTLRAMTGDVAWGVSTDADGVPTVKRFHVAWR
jgi:hypothetical protein